MATEILERGDIYFAYRPRVEQDEVHDIGDVQRLFVILQPAGSGRTRRVVIGRKRMPEPGEHERFWGFVDEVADRPEPVEEDLGPRSYSTRTRGARTQPEARPAGEGRYAIVRHGDHTHLAYALELPDTPGAVQHELDIQPEASYVIAAKNPWTGSPPGTGLAAPRKPDLPPATRQRFGNRRFIAAGPDLLDHEGIEFVLIAAAEDVQAELGVRLDTEAETAESAETFRRLRMRPDTRPIEPLTEGEWR